MPGEQVQTIDGIAYREALPYAGAADAPVALALHGYPTSSYLWRRVLPAAAEAGYRAIAPDLAGFGDSPADPPGTWERQVQNVERFRQALGLDRVVLLVHDWGGLIGLRWACDHPEAVAGLSISDTGFFPDGRWHGMARAMQTEGEGEQLVEAATRELFGQMLRGISASIPDDALDEYFKAFGDPDRRRSQLDLYRSGDFSELEPYQERLAGLDVPALVLWGARDEFAPVGGARRFESMLPRARLVVIDDAGHFIQEDAPERVAHEIGDFLVDVRG